MPDNSPSNPLDSNTTLKLTLPTTAERRVLTVIAKLHTDLSHDFTAAELGREVGLSESHLLALFKKTVGITLGHFHKQMRLIAAHDLFVTEFLTVKEVMARVGFHDRSHFNRDFKAAYGISPGEFRQQRLKGNYP